MRQYEGHESILRSLLMGLILAIALVYLLIGVSFSRGSILSFYDCGTRRSDRASLDVGR